MFGGKEGVRDATHAIGDGVGQCLHNCAASASANPLTPLPAALRRVRRTAPSNMHRRAQREAPDRGLEASTYMAEGTLQLDLETAVAETDPHPARWLSGRQLLQRRQLPGGPCPNPGPGCSLQLCRSHHFMECPDAARHVDRDQMRIVSCYMTITKHPTEAN